MSMNVAHAAMLLALASACAAHSPTLTSPGQTGPVRLTAAIDRSEIAPGATATVTFRLENLTAREITLDFGSTCQIMPYVTRRNSSDIVYPSGGGWACATMMTQLTLPPNGSTVKEFTITRGAGDQAEPISLPPGEYSLFAKLEGHKLESPRVALTVR
jgi:hypothetical protein